MRTPVGNPGPDTPSHRAAERIAALTGIRAIAALLVVLAHAGYWTGRYTNDLLGGFFSRLEVGVTMFFMLSGFLLFRGWVRAAQRARPLPSTTEYLRHRARRVLPAYWFVVTVVYLIYLVRDPGPIGGGFDGYLRNMTLTQIYGFGHLHLGLTQTWSLAVEASFYVVLPLIGWFAVRVVCRGGPHPIRLTALLCALMLVTPLWHLFTLENDSIDFTARLWLPGFMAWFAGGMLLALAAHHAGRGRAQWLVRAVNPYLLLLFAAVAFFMACTPLGGEATITPQDPGAAIIKSALYLVIAFGLMAPLVIGDDPGPVGWLCSRRPVVWLGEISYELFLVHVMVLELVVDVLGYKPFQGSTLVAFFVTLAISVPLAAGLHRALGRWIPTGGRLRPPHWHGGRLLIPQRANVSSRADAPDAG
ncbi:acyltransferase [Aldersonia sp. NBC_00410]|uniref:acyltransferase family protein n=1 Tax=Aldersonia sp. NBC_00410 TaxID=2975954 RepID=UPI00224E9CD2|nr:acyltransferase [Aldersonia sp. NBC_00410]MCX5041780.1 acyltransferase [Aldersonia sp. NBC_00410]